MAQTLVSALRKFFGYRPGQEFSDFMNEIRELTPKDREDFRRLFAEAGIEVQPEPKAEPAE